MGVYGVARDLAAAGTGVLKPPAIATVPGAFPCPIEIRTDDPEGCPAFYGRVIRSVSNGASPEWMQQRLIAAGQRPISALVDITNYLMLAFGRPAHAYDVAKLHGPLVARRAKHGEQVLALNEKTYMLDHEMTVIADEREVHDIAGIMGGEHSGVSADTTEVLLEIAYFDPERIGLTGRRLGLASDARTRFERGVDPAFLDQGLDLLTAMILGICGGEASQVVRAGSPPSTPTVVDYDPGLAERLGGIAISEEEQRRTLSALDFRVSPDWHVTAPLRRHDIEGPADIVEEVVRIHGLDSIESVALPRADGVARPTATPEQAIERKVRRAAAARGLDESVTWSFIPGPDASHFVDGNGGLWLLDNPISEDMKAMRPSLIPGLLAAAKRNLDRSAEGVRLFEIGRRYLRGEGGRSDERVTVGVLLAGEKTPREWAAGKAQTFDAFDAKAEVLALLQAAGAPVANLLVMGDAGPQFHPGQSATLRLGPKSVLARFGALHPKTLEAFDIDGPVMAAEVFLDAVPARKGGGSFARLPFSPPALQVVKRDFAFLVGAALPAGDLLRVVRGADKANIIAARVFDQFRGNGVPEGKKSLAIEVTLQPGDKSYTDEDLKAISDRIVAAAAKLGAELRH
jgi:phenylalanyl-tRNA synthetase beta chain